MASKLGWAISLAALGVGMWSALPAAATALAVLAVVASELGAWVALLGVAGAALSTLGWLRGRRRPWALVPAGAAIALGIAPVAAVSQLASSERISLPDSALLGLRRQAPHAAVETVTFATVGGQPLQLDISRPKASGAQAPAVVVIHGGSWRSGTRSELPAANDWWVDRGFAVFDVDYRLEPAPNWKLAVGDIRCALRWVHAHAEQYHASGDGLVILGRSAGAHLALLAGYGVGDAQLPASCDGPDPKVAAVISYYAPTDLRWGYDHPANQRVIDGPATLERLIGGPPASLPGDWALASPTEHVNAGSPPTLLFQGLRDQFVLPQNASLLAQRLEAAGVRHHAVMIPWAQHGFDHVRGGPSAALADAETARFLGLAER